MPFPGLDTAAVSRALSQITDRSSERVDAYFERLEEVVYHAAEGAGGEEDGIQVRREEGFAIRLAREERTWLASRDGHDPAAFSHAVRQVARVLPAAPYGEPSLGGSSQDSDGEGEAPADLPELAGFLPAVQSAIRRLHAAFPLSLVTRRHVREVQVILPRLVPPPQRELFYSVETSLPWLAYGNLLPRLGTAAADAVAQDLVAAFRARQAASPSPGRVPAVFSPAAAAVLLHETVAHALEADILALGGNPGAAVGVQLGPPGLSVLDDPSRAPGGCARDSDDEGQTTTRRWLLRDGVVEHPLADTAWADRAEALMPGAGRRGHRTEAPTPRSTCLEVVPGSASRDDLLAEAEGGLWITQVRSGQLHPLSGRFVLQIPFARRVRGGMVAETVGPFRILGTVADLLASIAGRGQHLEEAGGGWCAKGGQKLPVWARVPPLLISGVEVAS